MSPFYRQEGKCKEIKYVALGHIGGKGHIQTQVLVTLNLLL